ncbi:MAG: hypothetical protein JW734_08535 [Candidatus Omnitrophica bacterium]|nr:hypothetical protein [Candidatus Omnitrophota bacterium]
MKKYLQLNKQDFINIGLIISLFLVFLLPFFLRKPVYFSGYGLEWISPSAVFDSWHEPLTHLSFKLLYFFFGYEPFGYFMVNFILQGLNAILVYFLCNLIVKSRSVSLITSLLFSFHPAATMVVLGVNHFDNKIAAFFYILCVISFIKSSQVSTSLRREAFYFLSLVFFILGLASKLIVYSLPILIILYTFIYIKKNILKIIFIRCGLFIAINVIHLSIFMAEYSTMHRGLDRIMHCFSKPTWQISAIASYLKAIAESFFPFIALAGQIYSVQQSHICPIFSLNKAVFILVSFMLFVFLLRDANYRFSIIWIISTLLIAIGRWDIIVKVLYLPLVGACLLFSLLVRDGVNFLCVKIGKGKLASGVKGLVILLFLSSFFWAFQNKIEFKAEVSGNLKKGLFLMESRLKDISGKKVVIYAYSFPRYIRGLEAFTPILTRMFYFNPWADQWLSVNCPVGQDYFLRKVYETMMSRQDFELKYKLEGIVSKGHGKHEFSCESGIDRFIPATFSRFSFAYLNGDTVDITDKVFPKTRVVFKVSCPGADSISIIGDFNEWDKEKNILILEPDGFFRETLELRPGLYRYKFVINAKDLVANPNSEYYQVHEEFDKVSVLPIVNPLPLGLLLSGDDSYDRRVIETKKKVMFDPGSASLHKVLGDLFKEKGFQDIAELEYAEAERIIGR